MSEERNPGDRLKPVTGAVEVTGFSLSPGLERPA
jgi:hypothetical protein